MDALQGKILIVEHDPFTRDFLTEALGGRYHIGYAPNSWEALGKLLCGYWEVILVDQDLPELSGNQLIDKIRNLDLMLVTVLMVGEEIGASAPEVIHCDLAIRKPFFDPNRLSSAVEMAMKLHRLRATAIFS